MSTTPTTFENFSIFFLNKKKTSKNILYPCFPLFQLQMEINHTLAGQQIFYSKILRANEHPSTLALCIDLLTVTHT